MGGEEGGGGEGLNNDTAELDYLVYFVITLYLALILQIRGPQNTLKSQASGIWPLQVPYSDPDTSLRKMKVKVYI